MTKLKYFQYASICILQLLALQFQPVNTKPTTFHILTQSAHKAVQVYQAIFHNSNFNSHIKRKPDITPQETAINNEALHRQNSARISHGTKSQNCKRHYNSHTLYNANIIMGNTHTSTTGNIRKIGPYTNIYTSHLATNIFATLSPLQNKQTNCTTLVCESQMKHDTTNTHTMLRSSSSGRTYACMEGYIGRKVAIL